MGKKIVWCGNSYYGSPFKVGCNYYSELLAKEGNEVLFIAPPISPFHNKNENHIRFKQSKKGFYQAFDNYYIYTPYTVLPPIKKLPSILYWVIRIWHIFTSPNLKNVLKEKNFLEVDILVIDNFAFLPLVDLIKYEKLIVRVTDNLEGFGVGNAALIAENELIKQADKVIYTSSKLENIIKKLNINSVYVPNGVDNSKFHGDFEKPEIFNNIHKPIAVYIGAVENWFDFELLDYVSSELKNIHFLIIGFVKYKPSFFDNIANKDNVTFYGKIENHLVPNYLKYSNIGIIPFRLDMPLVHAISPLKLYEYMASGLPVVSTSWEELEHINSPAYLAKTQQEFKESILGALEKARQEEYINFAKDNDWLQKLKLIF